MAPNGAPEIDNAVQYLIGRFTHTHALAVGKGDHRVRRHFDVLDEIGVENHRRVVESCDVNHGRLLKAYRQFRGKD